MIVAERIRDFDESEAPKPRKLVVDLGYIRFLSETSAIESKPAQAVQVTFSFVSKQNKAASVSEGTAIIPPNRRMNHVFTNWVSSAVRPSSMMARYSQNNGGRRTNPQRGRQGRNRQPGAGRYDDQGSQDERPTGPALDERDLLVRMT